MSESAFAALGGVEGAYFSPLCLFVASYDELGYAIAISDGEGFCGEIDEDDADLATVVGIDGAWCVEQCDAVLESESGAGAHLCFVALWQGDAEARRYETALHGLQGNGCVEVGAEVEPCALRRGILWQRVVRFVDYLDLHCFFVGYVCRFAYVG